MQAKEVNLMNKNDELQELPECDIKILELVQSCGEADIETISKKLPRIEAVPLRVKRLAKQQYSQPQNPAHRRPLPNTSYLIGDGRKPEAYQLTDLGRIAVQDNTRHQKQERRRMRLTSVWLPILVSFVTTLVVSAPQWLLPLIERWLTSAP